MLKKIAILLAVVIVGILGFAMTKPDTFHLERTITVAAPPESVYALVNDYHRWSAWSPWEKLDPNMQRTYSGPDSGVGATYDWSGNSDVGSGRMQITETNEPTRIVMRLDFHSPMETSNTTAFDITSGPAGTNVKWSMDGPNNFLSKVMSVFVSMDKMIGPDFERGLANLKAEAEK